MVQDDIITIATFGTISEAQLAKLKLESEGIRSEVITQTPMLPGTPPLLPMQLWSSRLLIRAEDAERAAFILKESLDPPKGDPFIELIYRQSVTGCRDLRYEISYGKPREQAFEDIKAIAEDIGSVEDIDERKRRVDLKINYAGIKYALRVQACSSDDESSSKIVMRGNPLVARRFEKTLEKMTPEA